MATTTFFDYTGDGSDKTFDYSFPTFAQTDVVVEVNGVIVDNYTIDPYATSGTNTVEFDNTTGTLNTDVCESSGAPKTGLSVRVYRDTNVDSAKATYTAGASVKAGDLNNNQTQVLRALQEEQNQTITTSKIKDGAVTRIKIEADAIDGTKIANDAINSEHYAAGSIDLEHMSANSVDSNQYVDASIDSEHIANKAVTATQIADNTITGGQLANDCINSEHYVDGSIDLAHMSANSVDSSKIVNDSIVNADINSNAAIDATKIADGSVTSTEFQYINSVTSNVQTQLNAKQASDAKLTELATMHTDTASALADLTQAEVQILDGATVSTAELNILKDVTADKDDINIVTNMTKQTTISDSDTSYPTSGAVVDYVAAQIAPIGGLEVIADDESFPNTLPAAGVVISITDAAGLSINSSGVSTNGDTLDNTTVTINGFPSALRGGVGGNADPYVLGAGSGLMVQSTGSSQTYNYHKALLKESDFVQLSDDINDFNSRYRTAGSRTADNDASNDEGDLFFDQGTNKMYVHDGSAWGEVTSTGDFKYLVLCVAGSGAGNAGLVNGNVSKYDLRENTTSGSLASVTNAAQLMVSVNGVIQKPNTGTSIGSNTGFCMEDGHTIEFGANLPNGSEVFIIQSGSALTINDPGDGTVTEAKLNASNDPTNNFVLTADDTTAGGFKWAAAADTAKIEKFDSKVEVTDTDGNNVGKISAYIDNTEQVRIDGGLFIANGVPLRLGEIGGDYTSSLHLSGTSSGHTISSGQQNITFEAGGVNNNTSTYHDWIKLVHSPSAGTTATKVELYASDVKRLETSTTGVTVTGTVAATAYTGDGSSLTGISSTVLDGCGYQNEQTISAGTYSIAANKGVHSVGPITNSGTVTVSGNWVIS